MIYGSDEALPDRDGLAGNVIFCAWTGDSPMSSKSADAFTPVNVYQSYLTHDQKQYCEMASYDESVSSGLSLSERDPQGRLPARLSHASLRWRVHRSEGRLANRLWSRLSGDRTRRRRALRDTKDQKLRANDTSLTYLFRKQTAFAARWLGITHRHGTSSSPAFHVVSPPISKILFCWTARYHCIHFAGRRSITVGELFHLLVNDWVFIQVNRSPRLASGRDRAALIGGVPPITNRQFSRASNRS